MCGKVLTLFNPLTHTSEGLRHALISDGGCGVASSMLLATVRPLQGLGLRGDAGLP